MVEMAKANGLNIYEYLKFLLEHRPSKDMADEQLAELAPWSEKLQSTTMYLWLIPLTASKELPILLLKLLECREQSVYRIPPWTSRP